MGSNARASAASPAWNGHSSTQAATTSASGRLLQSPNVAGEAGRVEVERSDPFGFEEGEAGHHQRRQLLPDRAVAQVRPVEGHQLRPRRPPPS